MDRRFDQLSPVMEGFENPTMATVFREMLKVTPTKKKSSRGPKIPVATSSDGTCPPVNSVSSNPGGDSVETAQKVAFLRSILTEQRATTDSLLDSAKKMGPVAQKLVAKKAAYDAAFESDLVAPLPNISGTLQGFTLFFFVLSYFSLAIVVSIMSGSATAGLRVFGGFIIGFIVAIALISRLG
jgi:hypothetical protein